MSKDYGEDVIDLYPKCPGCGAGFKYKPFNRLGWYYAECGRRYNPERRKWAGFMPTGCLHRQLEQVKCCLRSQLKEVTAWLKKLEKRK